MAAHYWIKLYQDVLRDPKMGRLPDSTWRRCIELFLLAGEQDARDGILPELDDMAWQLRITREQLDCDLEILAAADIITLVDGRAFVTNFEKRQSADGSTERWRQWRDRQRNKNEKQTPPQPNSNGGKRKSNETFADIEKETDKEPEEEYISPKPPCREDEVTLRELPPEALPDFDDSQRVGEYIEAIGTQVRDYWGAAKNRKKFEEAAYMVIGFDATIELVMGFDSYWQEKGWYTTGGKASIDHFVDHWNDYINGVNLKKQPSSNGHHPHKTPVPSQGLKEIEPGVY